MSNSFNRTRSHSKWVLLLVLLVAMTAKCRKGREMRYSSEPVSSEQLQSNGWGEMQVEKVLSDVRYKQFGTLEEHSFDLYRPSGTEEKSLPLIVFVHSGAFFMGDKKNFLPINFCKDFCRTGSFAVASVNYSLMDASDLMSVEVFSPKKYVSKKIFEAVADVKHALIHFKSNADLYKIDPEQIFVMGFSAGGIIVHHLVFSSGREVESTCKGVGFSPALKEVLDEDIGALIKGAVSISGGMIDYDHIEDKDLRKVSFLAIHGTRDQIVPFDREAPFKKYTLGNGEISFNIFFETASFDSSTKKEIKREYRIKIGTKFSKYLAKVATGKFFPEICGSNCVTESLSRGVRYRKIGIKGAPHNFMINDNGKLTKSYLDARNSIKNFLFDLATQPQQKKSRRDRRSRRRR